MKYGNIVLKIESMVNDYNKASLLIDKHISSILKEMRYIPIITLMYENNEVGFKFINKYCENLYEEETKEIVKYIKRQINADGNVYDYIINETNYYNF